MTAKKAKAKSPGRDGAADKKRSAGAVRRTSALRRALKRRVPFEFVLEALAGLDIATRPMFGCTAIYLGERIVLILREKEDHRHDNGVWLATDATHHQSLLSDFPSMRSIAVLSSGGPTNWQNLPTDAADFEESALRACELIRRGDPRIGRVPQRKKRRRA